MKALIARKYLCLALIVCLAPGCTFRRWTPSTEFKDEQGKLIQHSQDIVIQVPDQRLPDFEKLTFTVRWLGISVGTVTTSVKGIKNINGRPCYVLEAVFKSSGLLSAVYKIEDRFVSYMDVEKLYTLRHEVYRREGKYRKDSITEFDQEKHQANFKNFIDQSCKTFPIPPGVQDTLTAVYYFMLLPVKVGDRIEYAVCNNEQNYQLVGVVQSKIFLKSSQGDKQAFLIQPYAQLKGKKVQKGNLSAFFSCDKRRVPLLGVLKGPIFTEVNFTLTKVEASNRVTRLFSFMKP